MEQQKLITSEGCHLFRKDVLILDKYNAKMPIQLV